VGRLQWGQIRGQQGAARGEQGTTAAAEAGPLRPAANPFAVVPGGDGSPRRSGGWLLNGHHHHGQGDQGQAQPLGLGGQLGRKTTPGQRRDRWSSGLNREGAGRRSQPRRAASRGCHPLGNATTPLARQQAKAPAAPPAPKSHERQLQRQGQQVFNQVAAGRRSRQRGRRRQRLLRTSSKGLQPGAARTSRGAPVTGGAKGSMRHR